MKIFINTHRKTAGDSVDKAKILERMQETLYFHQSMPDYSPTPLVNLSALASELGVEGIRIKDEGKRFGLKAFKALGASYAIYHYLREQSGDKLAPQNFIKEGGLYAKDIVFTTATDGNHGRAVAWIANLLGRPAVIYMPAGAADARIEAIKGEGAKVLIIDGDYDEAVRLTAEDGDKYGRTIIADTGYEGYMNIPRNIQQGYLTMFSELHAQMSEADGFAPDLVFIQSGVGAFAAAAAEFFTAFYPETRLVSVEPVSADCLLKSAEIVKGKPITVSGKGNTIMAGLNCGTPSMAAWDIIKNNFYAFTAIEDEWAEKAMRLLANHGVVSGESGCAGLAALIALKSEDPGFFKSGDIKNILLINTEADTDPELYQKIVSLKK